MATQKPRFSITMDESTMDKVDDYRFQNRITSQSKAIIELVKKGIAEFEAQAPYDLDIKNASPYSDEALRLANDYDNKLDRWGKQAVRDLTDTEIARCEDDTQFMINSGEDPEPKVINLFLEPSAAGIAMPLVGQDYEPYELKPDDPQGAAFAVRIQGDSMEPYFPDGSIVFVNRDALANGDIGIFCVDGGTVCKQYYYDNVLGITYLFSLNRKRSDCDIVLTGESNQSLVCQGRVMTKRRFQLPR